MSATRVMNLLSRTLFATGITCILIGLGTCVRYYQMNPPPEAARPGWDAEASVEAPIFFERFFYLEAGGGIAFWAGVYFRGKARNGSVKTKTVKDGIA